MSSVRMRSDSSMSSAGSGGVMCAVMPEWRSRFFGIAHESTFPRIGDSRRELDGSAMLINSFSVGTTEVQNNGERDGWPGRTACAWV